MSSAHLFRPPVMFFRNPNSPCLLKNPTLIPKPRSLRLRKRPNLLLTLLIPLGYILSHHIPHISLRHPPRQRIPYPPIHSINILLPRHIRRRPLPIHIDQHVPLPLGLLLSIDLLPHPTGPEIALDPLLGIRDRDALVAVELLFVRGEEGVDEAVDGVCVVWGGDDVCVPSGVDLPGVVREPCDAEVGGGWAAGEHLVLPEVGAVAEVGGRWAEGGLGEGAHGSGG